MGRRDWDRGGTEGQVPCPIRTLANESMAHALVRAHPNQEILAIAYLNQIHQTSDTYSFMDVQIFSLREVERNGKYGIRFQLELEYTVQNTATLRVKSFLPEKGGNLELHLHGNDVRTISEMLLEGERQLTHLTDEALKEANVLLELNPPMYYVVNHLGNKYKESKRYASILLNSLFDILDYQRDVDYDNPQKTHWFEALCNIRSEWSVEETTTRINNEKVHYGGDFESASDYWRRVADDSDMTLDEFFNSED